MTKKKKRKTRLTEEQVLEIRRLYKSPAKPSQYKLADDFNMTQAAVSMIVNRKTWKHV